MRTIILSLFIIMNIVAIIMTLSQPHRELLWFTGYTYLFHIYIINLFHFN